MDTFLARIPARDEKGGITARDEEFAVTGETLAQAVYLSGRVPAPALCSGLGRCGRCKVRYISEAPPVLEREKLVLSHHDLDAGWRLSCLREPVAGLHIALPPPLPPLPPHPYGPGTPARMAEIKRSMAVGDALAVDFGTTSVWWRDVCTGGCPEAPAKEDAERAADDESRINPQMGAGSDVVSRLAYAMRPEGRGRLRKLALEALRDIAAARDPHPGLLCVAANPAMTYILLDKDVTHLARAPYSLDYAGGAWEELPELGRAWIPPLVSPFVGGDISAGYASLALDPEKAPPAYPFILADLGTNGEMVLALSPDEALAASVAMGPALEGINLSFGMDAGFGAVTGYRVTPLGLEAEMLGETAPRGITGTGYLSLLRALKASGLLGEDGSFTRPGAAFPLAKRILGNEQAARQAGMEEKLRLPGKMFLSATDVEEIVKAKAAFSLALASLLRAADLPAGRLNALFLAGSLGRHLAPGVLADLGFVPAVLGAKIAPVGNSSLDGAALFLRHEGAREKSVAWSAAVRTLALADDPAFAAAFADHMRFSWRD